MTIDDRTTQADRVYLAVRDAILRGELAAGQSLSHVALAKEFGVSRIPVREALQRLEAERLLVSQPYRGHRVPTLDAEELEELIEIRIVLESLALRRHAAELDADGLEEIRRVNRSLKEETDPQLWLRGDWELHRLLSGGDTPSAEFIGDIRRRIHRYLDAAGSLGERHARAVVEHEGILAAVADGDLDLAARLLSEHIEVTGEALLSYLRGD